MWYIAHGWTVAPAGETPREVGDVFGLTGVTFRTLDEAYNLAAKYGGWVEEVIG